MNARIILFLFLFCNVTVVSAQAPKLVFTHLDARSGLGQDWARNMVQDKKGYIWINTGLSVNRYDGYKVKSYQIDDSGKFTNDSYKYLTNLILKNDTLFVGTSGGSIFYFDRRLDKLVQSSFRRVDNSNRVFFLEFAADDSNCLWRVGYDTNNTGIAERVNHSGKTLDSFSYGRKGKLALPGKLITAFLHLGSGEIWLGTSNGFCGFNSAKRRFDSFLVNPDTAHAFKILSLSEDISNPSSLLIIAGKENKAESKLYEFDKKKKVLIPLLTISSDPKRPLQMLSDKLNGIWIFTSNGMIRYDRISHKHILYPFAGDDKFATTQESSKMIQDASGKIWIATYSGLLNFDPSTGIYQRSRANRNDPDALAHIHVVDLLNDNAGLVWAVLDEYGVDRINKTRSAFISLKNDPDRSNSYPENVTGAALKKDGTFWLTTQTGIYTSVSNGGFKKVIKDSDPLAWQPGVLNDGTLFFANYKNIYVRYPSGKDARYSLRGGAVILNSFADRQDNIWVTDDKGSVFQFLVKEKKFVNYPLIDENGKNVIVSDTASASFLTVGGFYEDRKGTIWVARRKAGLARIDRAHRTAIVSSALSSAFYKGIVTMFEDRDGNFWISMANRGVYLFDRKTEKVIKRIEVKDNLLYQLVSDIVEDNHNNLWLSADRALVKYNYKTGLSTSYTSSNKIPLDFPGAVLKKTNGDIMLCMFNSMITFNPDELKQNSIAPQVQIETLTYSNPNEKDGASHTLNIFSNLVTKLNHYNSRVKFNYVALHYADPLQNQYAYMLEGYDKQWISAETQREAIYNNLPPGTYTFKVKAANSDGVWSKVPASYTIIIATPWWATWWAWLVYILLFVLAVYGYIRYRSRHLIRQNQVLEEKVSVRTSQLSIANEELSEQQEEITAQRDQLETVVTELKATQSQLIQSEKMASLGELTAGIAHEIQNPLNFVNNFSEVNREMITELKEALQAGDVQTALDISTDLEQNEEKIYHHGRRAEGIVKGMLEHSRMSTGNKEPTNLNKLADEYLRLAYHGLRAKDKSFNAELITHFDENLPDVAVVPQDIGRVLLNLFTNAFYAVQQKQKMAEHSYKPTVEFTSTMIDGQAQLKVKDNGIGIPDAIKEKIMQPFFTTKPTGQGTGLGLSLSYDIVVKGHSGKILVESVEGEHTIFTLLLPVK